MIFPDSVEDVCLILENYKISYQEVEELVDILTTHLKQLDNLDDSLRSQLCDMESVREEAEEYSRECRDLLKEVESRVKYDETLTVQTEFLAWECSVGAGMAEELGEQMQGLEKTCGELWNLRHNVNRYRELLLNYLDLEDDED